MSDFERKLLDRTHSANVSAGRSLIKHSIRQELLFAASTQFRMGAVPGAMIQPPQSAQVQPPVVSELNATAKP